MKVKSSLEVHLAKFMLIGVLLAAAVLLGGGLVYIFQNMGSIPGDHLFRGEPKDLRSPVLIFTDTLKGNDRAFIQLGLLILLANPLLRVALAALGFAAEKNWLYVGFSLLVLTVLLGSFFL